MKTSTYLLAAVLAASAAVASSVGAGERKIEVLAVYCPHWHEYPKGNEWFHKGFNEWEFVKDAKRRVPGQKIPLRPLYGFLDGKTPADDPAEMRAWIPDSTYGAHAFGYRSFDEWLRHRTECLDTIEKISPAALLRRIDPARAPHVAFQGNAMPKDGTPPKDPTHSSVFMAKFKEIADSRGVKCEIVSGPQPCYGAAFCRLAEILAK